MTADLTQRIAAALDEAQESLRGTTSFGAWEARPSLRRDESHVIHQPTGDWLARFVYPRDAEHAALWQPSRVLALIAADRRVLEQHGTSMLIPELVNHLCGFDGRVCDDCGGPWPCDGLTDLAARWGVAGEVR